MEAAERGDSAIAGSAPHLTAEVIKKRSLACLEENLRSASVYLTLFVAAVRYGTGNGLGYI
jgi:hypothetical protein